MKKTSLLFLGTLTLVGCGGTEVIDLNDKEAVADMQNVMELEYRDWTNTAEKMTTSMIKSGAFKNIQKPVIAIGDVKNDTMQRFDTDILVKKIRTTLVNSGTAQVTTGFQNKTTTATAYLPVSGQLNAASIGKNGANAVNAKVSGYQAVEYEKNIAEDETTHQVRGTRGNAEYDASTIAKQGTLIAPNMSLTGKMIQRNIPISSSWFSSTNTRVEYYLQMTLSDVKTGLSVWEDEQPIIKQGKNAPTW